jgi:hypothetical protein
MLPSDDEALFHYSRWRCQEGLPRVIVKGKLELNDLARLRAKGRPYGLEEAYSG